ncbi:MAG: polysaccharide pyruvyl transferase family protein, partial [Dongiaceae bacterium]
SIRSRDVTIGICLRGQQDEYGPENCLHRETKSMALKAAERIVSERGGRITFIDNHLKRSAMSPPQIIDRYAECDLVITSRYHGAMIALRQQVPFIAIDQIRGGTKVYNLIKSIPWPHLYKADQIDSETILASANEILEKHDTDILLQMKRDVVRSALSSLNQLEKEIRHLVG